MEPGRATPRKDRWKMQVKATRDRGCRIRVASPSRRPGGFIPRAEATFLETRARNPLPTLHHQRPRVRLRHPGSRQNRMTLFLNPATCTIQFSVYFLGKRAAKFRYLSRLVYETYYVLVVLQDFRRGCQRKIEGDYFEYAVLLEM